MRFIRQAGLWVRALFSRARVESEMEKEMRLHLELEAENNIRLGASPVEARRAAMIAFGGVERSKEAVRDERLTRWLEETISDLKLALRGFRRQPAFAAGVITLIALGIGPNTAIFSVVNHLLIAPLPFGDGNRMVTLTATAGGRRIMLSRTRADVELWRTRAREVEPITLVDRKYLGLGAAAFVGMRPLYGRDIEPTDTLADASPVVLVSYSLWRRIYGGRSDAI